MADIRRLPVPVTSAWDWQLEAACRDIDDTVFFHPERERGPAKDSRERHAKTVCARCPVIEQCRRYALAVQEPYGVWGGLTVTERVAILRHPSQLHPGLTSPRPHGPRTLDARRHADIPLSEGTRHMSDYQATTTVQAGEGVLFDYLSQVRNLPTYFTRMTSAEPGDGEEVHTTAQMPDGKQVEGDAWFRVDEQAHRIEWGSEGPNDYRGSLEVTDTGDGGADVQVRMHTTRVPDGSDEIRQGLNDTLATIKRLVEQQNAAG